MSRFFKHSQRLLIPPILPFFSFDFLNSIVKDKEYKKEKKMRCDLWNLTSEIFRDTNFAVKENVESLRNIF